MTTTEHALPEDRMTTPEFRQAVDEAKLRVAGMDRIDGSRDRELHTILSALECGLKNPVTGAQFDAFAMLEEIANRE